MAVNLIELGSKLAKCEIKTSDPEVKEAQKALASLMKTEEGRNEVAEIVKIALEDSYNKFDISPLIFEKKHFNYGDKPMFKTHKKGIKAYWTAPNSYVPKSRNYDTEIFMEFEALGVRPEASLFELKNGNLSSLASLVADGNEAIEVALLHKVYEVLAQTYNATGSTDNFKATNALDKATLDAAIRKVRKHTGGNPTIIGDYDLMAKIEEFAGFEQCEAKYLEIRNHGELGQYRACPMIYLPEILDEVTQESIVPTNKLFVVGRKIGYAADYGDVDFMQESDINDKSWNCRIDKECGWCVTKPEGLFVIEITE